MSDSSDSDNKAFPPGWILYRDRPEWKNVRPIPQDDGSFPAISKNYPEEYKDVYNYFRGVFVIGEKTERVLDLCTDALILDPANYIVWQYRRAVLKSLNYDLEKELNFITDVIKKNPKNYQVWHHRRVIIEWLDDGSSELAFTEQVLDEDEEKKNYHAWQHRQWVLTKYKQFDGELHYVNKLLKLNCRNNSAWNHRYFVINDGTQERTSSDVLNEEIKYVLEIIKQASRNESAWNYLRGILLLHNKSLNHPEVKEFCDKLYDEEKQSDMMKKPDEEKTLSPHLLAFLSDQAVELVEKDTDREENLKTAIDFYSELAVEYDDIRASYWNSLIKEIQRFEEI